MFVIYLSSNEELCLTNCVGHHKFPFDEPYVYLLTVPSGFYRISQNPAYININFSTLPVHDLYHEILLE